MGDPTIGVWGIGVLIPSLSIKPGAGTTSEARLGRRSIIGIVKVDARIKARTSCRRPDCKSGVKGVEKVEAGRWC